MQQQPQRCQQEGPEMKPVAHKHEALGGAPCLVLARWRGMNCVGGHRVSPGGSFMFVSCRRDDGAFSNPAISQRPRLLDHPPSEPFVEGTSSFARGSIAIAARNARASPLKHDSAIW